MEHQEENTHQELVDRVIALKAMRDVFDDAFEKAKKEYTKGELARSPFPKGDGSEFGEISGCFSKAEDEEVEQVFTVEDLDALKADTSEDFADFLGKWIVDNLPNAAREYFYEVGEVLDGCKVETVVTPPQPKKFRYMRVVPNKQTKEAVSRQLNANLAGLLGDAE